MAGHVRLITSHAPHGPPGRGVGRGASGEPRRPAKRRCRERRIADQSGKVTRQGVLIEMSEEL